MRRNRKLGQKKKRTHSMSLGRPNVRTITELQDMEFRTEEGEVSFENGTRKNNVIGTIIKEIE